MFSSIKEKLSGESNDTGAEDQEIIDDIENEVASRDQEISKIDQDLPNVNDLEQALEEEASKNPEQHVESDLETEELEPEDTEKVEDSGSQDSSLHKASLPGAENAPESLESQVQDFEEKIVSEESRELAKINDLENRVERMELESTDDLEERIARLENKVDSMQSVEKFNDRLEELEQLVAESKAGKVDELENKVEGLWEAFDEELETAEQRDEDEAEKIRLLWQALELKIDELRQEISNGDDEKVEELWEAMDEELMDVESQIHENRDEIQDLYSTVHELSELVKKQVDSNH